MLQAEGVPQLMNRNQKQIITWKAEERCIKNVSLMVNVVLKWDKKDCVQDLIGHKENEL